MKLCHPILLQGKSCCPDAGSDNNTKPLAVKSSGTSSTANPPHPRSCPSWRARMQGLLEAGISRPGHFSPIQDSWGRIFSSRVPHQFTRVCSSHVHHSASSLCKIVPSQRYWSQDHSLINLLLTKHHFRVVSGESNEHQDNDRYLFLCCSTPIFFSAYLIFLLQKIWNIYKIN